MKLRQKVLYTKRMWLARVVQLLEASRPLIALVTRVFIVWVEVTKVLTLVVKVARLVLKLLFAVRRALS